MSVDLSTFYVTVQSSTPIFKLRAEGKNSVIITTSTQKVDTIVNQAHRDPGYQASFNRCTSLGCSDYTQSFNYIPSCGECEKPLFPPFSDPAKITCFSDFLLRRVDYSIGGVLDTQRTSDYGGGMPLVDNRIETNITDYFYSDAYIEYKLYNGTNWTTSSTTGWKNFPGANGEVSYNKFYAMTGYWLGYEPCHGANKLYQCAVSCDSGEIVGCWQVGDLQREEGDNPLNTYGEAKFGSIWGFKGFEASYPQSVRYYQIYDPAQIVAAGLTLTKDMVLPLNPTLTINGYQTASGTGEQSESVGYTICQPKRTSLDFGDSDFLRETNCVSGGIKSTRSAKFVGLPVTDVHADALCAVDSYTPTRAIDKFLKFADLDSPSYIDVPLKDIPVDQFKKLKFSVIGDVAGKILTDGTNCFFPKSYPDTTVGKFLLGGPVDAVVRLGFKGATFNDLGLAFGFYFDDCMSCLEKKANAAYEIISTAKNEIARLTPFYDKCGVDIAGKTIAQRVSSGHLPYNIDCKCVRTGDIYITGAPIWKGIATTGYWSITEPWFSGSENASLYSANLPQKRKILAVIDNKQVYVDDPLCVPSTNPIPEENPDYPYASDRSPSCWDHNSAQYKRIWWFFDKSKKFTDLGFRSLAPMSSFWNWQPNGRTGTALAWNGHKYNSKQLWAPCGGLKDGGRAVVPFCITCYEKMQSKVDASNKIVVPSTLSIVTGIKLAAENEFTAKEIAYQGLPSVYAASDSRYQYGIPRSYLYYSRRAAATYNPCDNTNGGATIGTYKCSCQTLPCMDEIMIAAVPVRYGGALPQNCSDLSPGTSSFPSVYEMQLEGTPTITNNPETDKLYPLVGPNKYIQGIPLRTYKVGLDWDSFHNTRLQPENSTEIGGASAYKYQYATSFNNNGYFQNFYVDNHDPLYFWNRPISFLNSGVIIKSNSVASENETLFKLARLRDSYHINCSSSGTSVGEYGYLTTTLSANSGFSTILPVLTSTSSPTTIAVPALQGPVIPNPVTNNIN